MNWVKAQPDFEKYVWPMKVMKSGPRRGMEVQAPECYDIADAAVISFAGAHFLNNA